MTYRVLWTMAVTALVAGVVAAQDEFDPEPLVVSTDIVLEPDAILRRPVVIRGSALVLDGRGATLVGPGRPGDVAGFTGVGLTIEGGAAVTVRNLKIRGFGLGVLAVGTEGLLLEDCDASDNQTDPAAGWNDERRAGGLHLSGLRGAVVRRVRASRVWNGIDLSGCREGIVEECVFSHCSNTGARLRRSSRNTFRGNDLSYGLRVAPGEAHARDSCGLLVESGSDDNLFFRNDVRHGGNGMFVRISSGWTSRGNRFIENDFSHAHNHGVECWSPGNTWIRNRANHCSYGFWLGGSDGAVLIGNEAAFNGRPEGPHNAPEAGFGHGGIVFTKGAARHLRIEGNHLHDNGGPGIVIRGHRIEGGVDWPFSHVVIQRNRLERNLCGIWLEDGEFVEIRGNRVDGNAEDDRLLRTRHVVRRDEAEGAGVAPRARLDGPVRMRVGEERRFDASASRGIEGEELRFRFLVGGQVLDGPVQTLRFGTPGRHVVALLVSGAQASDLAWLDVLVTDETRGIGEVGTEGEAGRWSFVMGDDPDAVGRVAFTDDVDAVEGRSSLRLRPDPYRGRDVAAVYSFVDRPLDLSRRTRLAFWIRYRNPNFWGFQGPNPVVRLLTKTGYFTYTPVGPSGPRNLLWELPEPEGREDWIRLELPLAGGGGWERTKEGEIALDRIQSLSIQFDSWGGDPFTIWLDGLRFE
ncbi:MAG: right-handed parallel beta-helix repeat-containing protein [Planctomycetota bacterium]